MKNNVFIFCHQAKTGGSTLVSIFTKSLGNNRIYNNLEPSELKEISDRDKENGISKPIFIHGHFSPLKYKELFPNAIYLTIFREPTQYINSLYHFWKRTEIRSANKLNPLRAKLLANDLSLTEFTYAYADYSKLSYDAYDPNKFDWVGITEKYDNSLRILKNKFSFLETSSYIVKRNNPNKSISDSYPNKLEPLVHELLKTEYQLYNAALKRFYNDFSSTLDNSIL